MDSARAGKKSTGGVAGPSELESYVASLYSILGYNVKTNVPLGGQQIDVLVERHLEGIGVTRIIIECKYKTSGSVSNQDVFDTISAFDALMKAQGISHCVMVTNTRFSQQAQNAADNNRLFKLVQLADLEDDLVNVADSLLALKKGYESEQIFHEFLPQSAHGKLPYSKNEGSIENLLDATIDWIENFGEGFLTILGDFGGGKTTLLRRLEYEHSSLFLQKKTRHRPLYFTLKDYSFYDGLDDFIASSARQKYQRNMPPNVFWTLAKEAGFLFLLDGFDEIITGSDRADRAKTFLSLHRLVTSGSPVILTCRPAYFVSSEELNDLIRQVNSKTGQKNVGLPARWDAHLFNIGETNALTRTNQFLFEKYVDNTTLDPLLGISNTVVNLEVFRPAQIDEYLAKFDEDFQRVSNSGWREVKSEIEKIYDLTDLMKRPIMLSMIKDTILQGQIDIRRNNVIGGAFSLYDAYTSLNLKRDWGKSKGRKLLNEKQRQEYAQLIALTMFKRGSLDVDHSEIVQVAKKTSTEFELSAELNQHNPEQIAADIQVTTFLSRQGSSFRFAHKSFMEFFVAKSVVERLSHPRLSRSSLAESYPREIISFIGEAASINLKLLGNALVAYRAAINAPRKTGETAMIKRNVLGILLCSQDTITTDYFSDNHVWELSVRKRVIDGVVVRETSWDYCGWHLVTLSNSSITRSAFVGWRVEGGNWLNSSFSGRLQDCHFEDLEMSGCVIAASTQKTIFQSCQFSGGALTLRGEFQISGSRFKNTVVSIEIGVGAISRLASTSFEDCEIADVLGPQTRPVMIERCNFSDCHFVGFTPSSKFVERLIYENEVFSKGLTADDEKTIILDRCAGIFFIDEFDDRIKIGKQGFKAVGDLFLVAQGALQSKIKSREAFDKAIRKRLEKPYPELLDKLKATFPAMFIRTAGV
ncbi:restriction endonuclease [Rhizobium sp. WYCCWR 11146]|uniref:restriction endonuclease n=1 Tax=Rhizobium sp. WYCCWR 11146 TaxID=2749833 RepID=UPI0015E7A82C|nr:restriction endonuclease [Rhizobium sp. WYCCWR 11146]MBA1344956.1 restriction endonuclease [Rhizobium sp. WYCCWR 11146]